MYCFYLLWEINHCVSDAHTQTMYLYLALLHISLISLYNKGCHMFFSLLSAVYICPSPSDFYFCRSKSITPYSRLKPCILSTVNVHPYIKGN